MPTSESAIVSKILKHLNAQPRTVAWKNHGSAFATAGVPDISVASDGTAGFLEAKRPGHFPTLIQAKRLHKLDACGMIAGVVRSVEDVSLLLAGERKLLPGRCPVCQLLPGECPETQKSPA